MTESKFAELKQKVLPVATKYKLDKLYLFGSRARGEECEDSDFDFYIEGPAVKSLFQLGGLLADLETAVGNKVDIVLKPLSEHKKIKDYLMRDIQRDGVLLYVR